MKYINHFLVFIIMFGIVLSSCKKDPDPDDLIIKGCTDAQADNFDPNATESDGSCTYQKRFVGEYDINVQCDQSSALFEDADLEIKFTQDQHKVLFDIESSSTLISFFGTIIHKDTVSVDTLIPGFQADLKNLVPLATESQIVTVDLGVKTDLALSKDNKTLSGLMKLKLISKDTINYNGIKIPPITLDDHCTLQAVKEP